MRANTGAPSLRQLNSSLILTHRCLGSLTGQAAAERVSNVRREPTSIVPETAQHLYASSRGCLASIPNHPWAPVLPPHTFKRRRKFENSQPPSSLFPLLLCLTPHAQPPVPCCLLLPSPTHSILMFQASPSPPSANLPDWPSSVAGEGRQLRRRPEVSSSSSSGTWIEEARARVHCFWRAVWYTPLQQSSLSVLPTTIRRISLSPPRRRSVDLSRPICLRF